MSKATVLVRLKSEVLDPQGDAVKRALDKLGFDGIRGVRIGKLIEIDLGDAPIADKPALEARGLPERTYRRPCVLQPRRTRTFAFGSVFTRSQDEPWRITFVGFAGSS
jgi:phosphoribosylformylglycinamidine synthase PurS subunit